MAIWCHVAAETSERAATRFCERIRERMRPLCTFPQAGAPRDQLSKGLRAAFVGRYVIYYVHDDASLVIVRVLHGARDVTTIIADSGLKI